MLEQSIKILEEALNASAKAGVFNLKEATVVFQSLTNVVNELNTLKQDVEVEKENLVKTKSSK